jgi:hypothetical protein
MTDDGWDPLLIVPQSWKGEYFYVREDSRKNYERA